MKSTLVAVVSLLCFLAIPTYANSRHEQSNRTPYHARHKQPRIIIVVPPQYPSSSHNYGYYGQRYYPWTDYTSSPWYVETYPLYGDENLCEQFRTERERRACYAGERNARTR